MKRTVAGLLVFVAAVSIVAAQPAAWIAFKLPEGRYSALLPAAPKLTVQEGTAKTGQKFPQYLASAQDGDNAFLVGYFDILPGLVFTLAEGRDGMLEGLGGTLITESPTTLRGNAGLDLTIEAKSEGVLFVDKAKIYRVGERVYVIQAIFPKTVGASEIAEKSYKFFTGFDISTSPY